MRKKILFFISAVALVVVISAVIHSHAKKARVEAIFKEYVAYFKSAYEIMDKNYYLPVSKELFDAYVADFRNRIFNLQVKDKSKVDNGIKHIATGILVSKLKNPKDSFTNFFPPQMVKEFKQSVLGYTSDIGIEGALKDGHFIISQVEPRSDAFKKGISIGDDVLKAEGRPVAGITGDELKKIFSPPQGKEVELEVLFAKTKMPSVIKVISSQYFKQSVFVIQTQDPKVDCLQIRFFNEETGNELNSQIDDLNKRGIDKLIIDLRNNGGGPPLAAWAVSGIFLDTQSKLFYFLRREGAPNGLVTPPSTVKYKGEVSILINKGTGSASEIFAGFMQAYHRAVLVGENSAGQVFLKSLFDLSDGATMELTVAKGYLFTGDPIDTGGLKPDVALPDDGDLLRSAVNIIKHAK